MHFVVRYFVPALLVPAAGLSAQRSSLAAVDSSTLGGESARTLSEALAGRVAGVSVLRSSGVLGTGSRVRMRGGSGLVIPREPLLVVDGVRVDDRQSSLGIDIGGQTPSRLDDIPLDDVERIDVLPGPAASALYGADAAGGVIVVTTKHSSRGPTHWSSYVETGLTTDASSYPTNTATGPADFGASTCTRADATVRTCTPGPLSSWNPLEQASPFRTGMRLASGANASGGSHFVQYYVGATGASGEGRLAPNDAQHYSGRGNVDVRPIPSLRLGLRGSFVTGHTTLPAGDTYFTSALYDGLLGNTADDSVRRGYNQNDVATIASIVTRQHIERSLGSVDATWSPITWLTARALLGREIMRRDDSQTVPQSAAYGDPTRSGVSVLQGSAGRDLRTTIDGGLTATYSLGRGAHAETTIGAERITQSFRVQDSTYRFGEDGSVGATSLRRAHASAKTVGAVATQRLVWGGRQLTVGVRHDNDNRGQFLKGGTYWSANATWDIGRESFFHPGRALSDVAFRAAYGVAGDTRPLPVVFTSRLVPSPPGQPFQPLPSFDPEKVSEVEIGFDVRSLGDRLRASATWYRQHSANSYERGCCVGPFFYDNKGAWHTNGVEITAAATLVQRAATRWDASLTFSSMVNRYDGGPSNNTRALDPFFGGARRLLVPGYPIAGVWGRPVTGSDANGDGVIVPSEIMTAKDSVYIGASIPTRQAALLTSLTVFRWITLAAHVDYVGGFTALNGTEVLRCEMRTCAALYDPDASISDQTRAVAVYGGQTPGFHESGDFVRLRELAVTWVLAPDWSRRHGLARLALAVAGRNLLMSTGYSGLDPEVNELGQSTFGTTEYFTLPLARTMLVRLDVHH
jgi:TonB-dependent SusC/RagA subfamily outer membrane receptor